jgi:hypothetical protein
LLRLDFDSFLNLDKHFFNEKHLEPIYTNIYHIIIHTYIHAYIHTHIRIYIHTYTHTCMHTYVCIYTYIGEPPRSFLQTGSHSWASPTHHPSPVSSLKLSEVASRPSSGAPATRRRPCPRPCTPSCRFRNISSQPGESLRHLGYYPVKQIVVW